MKQVSLKTSVDTLEDGIITVSGPALAISGIIAGVDLVTGGNILRSYGWLALTWAICLLLTLDFQVLALGARAHRVYLSTGKDTRRKVFEIVLAVAIAAAISYVSVQMQSIIARANSVSPVMSIDAAAAQMGINQVALIWERSALVLILIFLSGWFREGETGETPAVSVAPAASITEDVMQIILTKLAKLDDLERAILDPKVSVVEEVKQGETPVALLETPSSQDETEASDPALDAQLSALLAVKSDLSSRDVAAIVGKPHSTVYRALKQMKQE